MKPRMSIALAVVALLAGCSSGNTINPEEPATVAELGAAVTTASQALLSNSGIETVAGYFRTEDAASLFRYDWAKYRSDGDVLAVFRYLDRDYTEGLSLSAGSWMTSLISADETHPWQPESLGSPAEVLSAIGRLQSMAAQQTPEESAATATKQTASDGSALWTLTIPGTGDTGATTREWIINADGLVQYHRVAGDEDFGDGATIIVFEYAVADTDPLVVPVEGTPLVIDDLGIPDAVRDLETP